MCIFIRVYLLRLPDAVCNEIVKDLSRKGSVYPVCWFRASNSDQVILLRHVQEEAIFRMAQHQRLMASKKRLTLLDIELGTGYFYRKLNRNDIKKATGLLIGHFIFNRENF